MANNEGEPLHGDRSAWNTIDFADEHAKDIDDATLKRHLDAPDAAGEIMRDNGVNWIKTVLGFDDLSGECALSDLADYTRGDLIVGGVADWDDLAVGAAGTILRSDGIDPSWQPLNENTLALLGSATIDTQNGDGKTTVYTVPAGKSAIITHVIIHSPSASLAGGTDFDIGSGALANTWRQTIDLSTMTAITDYMVIPSIAAVPVKYTLEVAGSAIGILPITGAVADTTATMTIFGYLI